MIRPVSGQSFLSTEPEISVPVLNGAPDRVGLEPIEARQGGPDVAIEARDTARSADPQNPIPVMQESGHGIVQQALFVSLNSRELSIGQPAEAFVRADPNDSLRRREHLEDRVARQ